MGKRLWRNDLPGLSRLPVDNFGDKCEQVRMVLYMENPY